MYRLVVCLSVWPAIYAKPLKCPLLRAPSSGNVSQFGGGGIYNEGTLGVNESTVSDNEAEFVGGGIENSGVLTLTNSTVSGNRAMSGFGSGISNSGVLMLTASTLSGNETSLQGRGTAIGSSDDESVVESYATIIDGDCVVMDGVDVTWASWLRPTHRPS